METGGHLGVGAGQQLTTHPVPGRFQEFPLNPKALSLGELYGEYDLNTNEWTDGVLSSVMRAACAGAPRVAGWRRAVGLESSRWGAERVGREPLWGREGREVQGESSGFLTLLLLPRREARREVDPLRRPRGHTVDREHELRHGR